MLFFFDIPIENVPVALPFSSERVQRVEGKMAATTRVA